MRNRSGVSQCIYPENNSSGSSTYPANVKCRTFFVSCHGQIQSASFVAPLRSMAMKIHITNVSRIAKLSGIPAEYAECQCVLLALQVPRGNPRSKLKVRQSPSKYPSSKDRVVQFMTTSNSLPPQSVANGFSPPSSNPMSQNFLNLINFGFVICHRKTGVWLIVLDIQIDQRLVLSSPKEPQLGLPISILSLRCLNSL
jgi:hypothetical protein